MRCSGFIAQWPEQTCWRLCIFIHWPHRNKWHQVQLSLIFSRCSVLTNMWGFGMRYVCLLQDIFVTLCQLDSDKYFMCNIDEFKFFASMIEHVPLALRARYVFACAPIPKSQPFVCTMLLKVFCLLYLCIVLLVCMKCLHIIEIVFIE